MGPVLKEPRGRSRKGLEGSLPCTNSGESKGVGPLPFTGKVTPLVSETQFLQLCRDNNTGFPLSLGLMMSAGGALQTVAWGRGTGTEIMRL